MNIKKKIQFLLKEYINQHLINFKRYLNRPRDEKLYELANKFYYLFDDFMEDVYGIRKSYDNISNKIGDNRIPRIYNDDPSIVIRFGEYLYNLIINGTDKIDYRDVPSWFFFFGNNIIVVKNLWLIHFTDNAEKIAEEGFKIGSPDIEKLGLTTWLDSIEKPGGYNFAYLLKDFERFGKLVCEPMYNSDLEYIYGCECVIFRGSGLCIWHKGDREPQVIFWGSTAKDIIPIVKDIIKIRDNKSGEYIKANCWVVKNKRGRILFGSRKLIKVVKWVINNYIQYRKNF